MRIDRSHYPWVAFVTVATVLSCTLYLANFHPSLLPGAFQLPSFFGETPPIRHTYGGTPLGLIFGSISFAIFLFAAALGIRKKRRLWPIGSVQTWLKGHIWLTILTIPLVLLHCGFTTGGSLASGLMLLYFFVMVSGFFGIALQQFIPRIMKERMPREFVFEQIPYLRGGLVVAANKLRAELHALQMQEIEKKNPETSDSLTNRAPSIDSSEKVLIQFLDDDCIPYLSAKRGKRHRLRSIKRAETIFRFLSLQISPDWKPKLEQIRAWCDDRRVMDQQTGYQHWLHGWLIIHIPTSFALLIVTTWHAWAALRFLVLEP